MADQEPQDGQNDQKETREETRAAGGHTPSQPYTIHHDALADTTGADEPAATSPRGGPDPIALVAGLVALAMAALAATGTLDAVDPRWVLAIGALLVGGTVLVASLRRRA